MARGLTYKSWIIRYISHGASRESYPLPRLLQVSSLVPRRFDAMSEFFFLSNLYWPTTKEI